MNWSVMDFFIFLCIWLAFYSVLDLICKTIERCYALKTAKEPDKLRLELSKKERGDSSESNKT